MNMMPLTETPPIDEQREIAAIAVARFLDRESLGLLDLVEAIAEIDEGERALHGLIAACDRFLPSPGDVATHLDALVEALLAIGIADIEAAHWNAASPQDPEAALRWYLGRLAGLRHALAAPVTEG